jgi:hypothetical protein
MRKLTLTEQAAMYFLERDGPLCPGLDATSAASQKVIRVLDSLVKKKRAVVEMTDDGPRYSLSALGREELQDA